jgi:2-keto-myo-inositol isomerase
MVALDPRSIYAFHLDDVEECAKEAVADAIRLLSELGVAPAAEVCARHNGIGYDGSCSIDLFCRGYWEWNPPHVAVKAREAAIQLLVPYFNLQ